MTLQAVWMEGFHGNRGMICRNFPILAREWSHAGGLAVSDPPTPAEVQALAGKVDELLAALRR